LVTFPELIAQRPRIDDVLIGRFVRASQSARQPGPADRPGDELRAILAPGSKPSAAGIKSDREMVVSNS
jgi:hypothetical protein